MGTAIFNSRMDTGLTTAKNVFFVGVSATIGLCTLLMNPAAAEPNGRLMAPVYHAPSAVPKLSSDSPVKTEQLHRTANKSYKVAGKRYYPLQKVADFSQEGKASWYGGQFHGRKTSSGERYNKHQLTAAHPTLPIPSYARVTNLKNGKTVVVRINDRGPFHSNRIMDVSQAAAQQLGFISHGTARVRVEQLQGSKEAVATNKNGNIYVDLQHFRDVKEAQAYLNATSKHLKAVNSDNKASLVKVKNNYVVRMGPFREQERADSMKKAVLTAL